MSQDAYLDQLAQTPADPWGKLQAPGITEVARDSIGDRGLTVDDFTTPVLVADAAAMAHNVLSLQEWCDVRGYLVAPHGKSTMAPQLWARQLAAGAWGITVATDAQLRIALRIGVPRVQLANNLLQPQGIAELRGHLAMDPRREVLVWVDSVAAVAALASDTGPEISVLLDVGWPGGRTGVRDAAEAAEVVDAIGRTPGVRLAGTAGYEGAIGASEADADAPILAYLEMLVDIHRTLVLPLCPGDAYLSVGGSDQLAAVDRALGVLAPAEATVLVRSGMSIVHDDGLYSDMQADAPADAPRFVAALSVVSTVLAVHDGGRAILDLGRRDVGFDHGLPVARELWRDGAVLDRVVAGRMLDGLNDQHGFLPEGAFATEPRPGDKVVCGVSHSCTTLDRWRDLLEIPDRIRPASPAVGVIRTLF